MNDFKTFLNIEKIINFLPHRFLFLLIDQVVKYKKFFLYALKFVSINDFFLGHFPKKFVFPGVLIIESIAQASGLLSIFSKGQLINKELIYLVSIQNAFFKKQVYPGNKMIIKVFYKKKINNFEEFDGIVLVDNTLICKATLLLSRF
ncbi:(3R)-hydroxymyristoyl-[acyl carrier protein] dehydratase [Buchnera aphidicola (Cinara tujafilina)]|uniref:3-hydroxyacyl-[acyl-carrier-protein] dehydratase FabZ n=1 Tax=Buchnera aphidicola (Cinara tujafilina) TaxID=261317 RepID=F7WZ85_9GAMM|nr:3-hydroxyacyl-ACP dehydratase FabZ [Buchnera aphidicola]AEH39739.1 (3R)-hydroxymyristoyl-[acyl carrier protein] dehydratase [Buchnera aphidicola (Cinara tujafilina)]